MDAVDTAVSYAHIYMYVCVLDDDNGRVLPISPNTLTDGLERADLRAACQSP